MAVSFKGVRRRGSNWRASLYLTKDVQGTRPQVELGTYQDLVAAVKARDKALYVLGRHDEVQMGLTAEEKQQLRGFDFEQLLSTLKAASFSTGASAYRGVSFDKSAQKYQVFIRVAGKNKKLGTFQLEEDAAEAYDKAAITVLGSKAHLNFPGRHIGQASCERAVALPTSAQAVVLDDSGKTKKPELQSSHTGVDIRPLESPGAIAELCAAATPARPDLVAACAHIPSAGIITTEDVAVRSKMISPDTATDWSGAEEAGSDTFSDYCSSWGSGEEVWGYETDYYDSEEEAEAVSELLKDPDYQYLVKHNGQPSLSLLGGPNADISAANLLHKYERKWAAEAEAQAQLTDSPALTASKTSTPLQRPQVADSPALTASNTSTPLQRPQVADSPALTVSNSSTCTPLQHAQLGVHGPTEASTFGVTPDMTASDTCLSYSLATHAPATTNAPSACSPTTQPLDTAACGSHFAAAADAAPGLCAAPSAGKLVPSEDAVRMANVYATAVPGMSPADYRETLYQTWMTGEPAGMQYMEFDSDIEAEHVMGQELLTKQDDSPDVTAEKLELSNKRQKLSADVADIGQQVQQMQASITKHDASVDDLASVPWWAKEMGMTDTEYWSSLRECNQAASNATPDSRITPVQITQEDLVFIASKRCSPDMSAIQL